MGGHGIRNSMRCAGHSGRHRSTFGKVAGRISKQAHGAGARRVSLSSISRSQGSIAVGRACASGGGAEAIRPWAGLRSSARKCRPRLASRWVLEMPGARLPHGRVRGAGQPRRNVPTHETTSASPTPRSGLPKLSRRRLRRTSLGLGDGVSGVPCQVAPTPRHRRPAYQLGTRSGPDGMARHPNRAPRCDLVRYPISLCRTKQLERALPGHASGIISASEKRPRSP